MSLALYYDIVRRLGLDRRTQIKLGCQGDPEFLTRAIESCFGKRPVDIVIDDGSHFYDLTKTTFDHLFFRHLRSGGLYCIEDWEARYWPKW